MSKIPHRLRQLAGFLEKAPANKALTSKILKSLDKWEAELGIAKEAQTDTGHPQTEMSLDAVPPQPPANMDETSIGSENGGTDRDADNGAMGVIEIWGDGSCAPNPGPGGWGTIVQQNGQRQEYSGASAESTNNIMELTAAIEGLKRTPVGTRVVLTTDSRYLVDGITKWIKGWKRKGWRKSDGGPVLNREIWQILDGLDAERDVKWCWVRGHSGHPENERCDELANQARTQM